MPFSTVSTSILMVAVTELADVDTFQALIAKTYVYISMGNTL